MKGRPDCPHCAGRGILIDPDPLKPARVCACVAETKGALPEGALPARYREASFDAFWDWWKAQHREDGIAARLQEAQVLISNALSRGTLPKELALQLDHILHKCGPYAHPETNAPGWKRTKPALQPMGFENLQDWAQKDKLKADHWWISGPPQSGRSTIAAAALRAWSQRTGRAGRFVSVRTLSQELKDVYYDVRSFKNQDFRSERDLIEPLLEASCLVLDDFDRLDGDTRVARAVAELLDRRYAEERPTLLTAIRSPKSLMEPEGHPLGRLEDLSLVRRLQHAHRLELRPTLESLLDTARVA